jgi:carbon storage regulator
MEVSMLVLSRQIDETIMIGDDIEVTVVDIRGDKVRLGITAPKAVAVHRKEVYEAIKKENKAGTAYVVPNARPLTDKERTVIAGTGMNPEPPASGTGPYRPSGLNDTMNREENRQQGHVDPHMQKPTDQAKE